MLRPALGLLLLVLYAQRGHAGEMPRRIGMYPVQGAPLAMLDSRIEVRVRGPIVEAVIEQTYRNDTDRVTEATYIFPLPIDAAVSAMSIKLGSRTIVATIGTREDAQQRYEQAVAAGLGAGVLDQERPDVFTQTISAIPAHGEVKVSLRVDSLAQYRAGTWELVLPLTIAPRYVPGSATGRPTTGTGRAPDTDRAPDASRVTPVGGPNAGGSTQVAIDFADAVEDVASPTHEISKGDRKYEFVDLKSDHDAIVRWRSKASSLGWVEQDGDAGFAAVLVEAPPATARTGSLRLQLLLDRSATTRGDAEAVERPLSRALLAALGSSDTASIGGSNQIEWTTPDKAQRALDDVWARPAGALDLTKLFSNLRARDAAIVFVGDGLVADDRAVVAAATRAGVPIHVIGVGPAPNRSLLAAIAQASGGALRFAAIGDDVSALARDVLADAASPPPALTVNWGALTATDVTPGTLPRLGAGQSALVIARVERFKQANARTRGDVFLLSTVQAQKPPEGALAKQGPIGRRWAKQRLDELLAAGNVKQATAHALRYGVVSPYTSLVAVGTDVVITGGVKHSVPVPVSVPAGMHWLQVREQTYVKTGDDRPAQDKLEKDRDRRRPEPTKKAKPADEQDEDAVSDKAGYDDAEPTAPAPARTATVDTGGAAGGESIEAVDENPIMLSSSESSSRSPLRFTLGLGGGLAIEKRGDTRHLDPTLALNGRVEFSLRRALVGAEASLWLVRKDPQLVTSFTLGYRLTRLVQFRTGFGVHLGADGFGPAWNLTLRTRFARTRVGSYLRYDGALLRHDDAGLSGQNTTTLGVEASW